MAGCWAPSSALSPHGTTWPGENGSSWVCLGWWSGDGAGDTWQTRQHSGVADRSAGESGPSEVQGLLHVWAGERVFVTS